MFVGTIVLEKINYFSNRGHCMRSTADVILNIFEEKLPEIYKTNKVRQSQVQMALDIAEFLDTDKKMMSTCRNREIIGSVSTDPSI